ncbi:hypothetical protein WN48_08301 [Eufriesea mexicana]|uniref:Uncharacterized protein n=1 Tax=Eufriesea mexicana TaxID=516756 RepID=A0A310SAT7_9HYME|nr:hypothetical protein WN48_08301 [Eufriesea mexicana]
MENERKKTAWNSSRNVETDYQSCNQTGYQDQIARQSRTEVNPTERIVQGCSDRCKLGDEFWLTIRISVSFHQSGYILGDSKPGDAITLVSEVLQGYQSQIAGSATCQHEPWLVHGDKNERGNNGGRKGQGDSDEEPAKRKEGFNLSQQWRKGGRDGEDREEGMVAKVEKGDEKEEENVRAQREFLPFSSRPWSRNSTREGRNERNHPLPLGSSVSARFSVSSELLLPLSRRKETDLCTGQSIVRAWPWETRERRRLLPSGVLLANEGLMGRNGSGPGGESGGRGNGHPGDNPFYSNIDSMPDIRPRRKSVPLVSELVRNQLSINLAEQCPLVYAYMDMYTYKAHGRVFALSVPSIFVEGSDELTHKTPRWALETGVRLSVQAPPVK